MQDAAAQAGLEQKDKFEKSKTGFTADSTHSVIHSAKVCSYPYKDSERKTKGQKDRERERDGERRTACSATLMKCSKNEKREWERVGEGVTLHLLSNVYVKRISSL
jgi:hypothetical protein